MNIYYRWAIEYGQAFNIALPEENYRISEIAEIVKNTVPGCKIEYAEGAGPDKRCYRVDSSKAYRVLTDFKPEWNASKGALELFDTYKRTTLTVEEFEGPKYKRIDHIKLLMDEGKLDNNLRWHD